MGDSIFLPKRDMPGRYKGKHAFFFIIIWIEIPLTCFLGHSGSVVGALSAGTVFINLLLTPVFLRYTLEHRTGAKARRSILPKRGP